MDTREYRVKYMRSMITEEYYKEVLYIKDIEFRKDHDKSMCIDFLMNSLVDIMLDFVNYKPSNINEFNKNLTNTIVSILNLRGKYNLELSKVETRYKVSDRYHYITTPFSLSQCIRKGHKKHFITKEYSTTDTIENIIQQIQSERLFYFTNSEVIIYCTSE